MEPKQPTFSIGVVPCNGCTACCHGPIMLHPGLGDDATKYEAELTPYGMKLKQKPDASCIYLDDYKCSIWPNTPAVCRAFDCRAYVRAGLHLRDPLGDEAVTAAGKARL
jgi:Fe-S-cluster containining protein